MSEAETAPPAEVGARALTQADWVQENVVFVRLPAPVKVVYTGGAAIMLCTSYVLAFASSKCFVSINLADTLEDGYRLEPTAGIHPAGYAMLGLLALGILCYWYVVRWIAGQVRLAFSADEGSDGAMDTMTTTQKV